MDRQYFENGVTIINYTPERVFPRHKSRVAGDCCVFKLLWPSVKVKHLIHFQSDLFFKFLRRAIEVRADGLKLLFIVRDRSAVNCLDVEMT